MGKDIWNILRIAKAVLPTCQATYFGMDNTLPLFIFRSGHGRHGGGAKAPDGTPEWLLNHLIAKQLFGVMAAYEHNCVWLNPNAKHLPNWLREGTHYTREIQRIYRGPVVFFSIHCNAIILKNWPNGKPSPQGVEVLYPRGSGYCRELADELCNSIVRARKISGDVVKRGAKPRSNLHELRPTVLRCPSVIIECGFLTNADELAALKSESAQRDIARGIMNGLERFFQGVPK